MRTAEMLKKIRSVEIQGAHNVAGAGMKALCQSMDVINGKSKEDFLPKMRKIARSIAMTRPTEPALRNAMSFILMKALDGPEDIPALKSFIKAECGRFGRTLRATMEEIAKIGSRRIENGSTVFTHCHSNTVMAILKYAKASGKKFSVICTETRPLHQGYLTAKELASCGIPVTLVVDSAARAYMKKAGIVMMGADAVAVNGAVINKIGSSLVALAAHEQRKPVIVAAGSHKIDPMTIKGFLEPIEQRPPGEIIDPKHLRGVAIENPAFDVVPAEYIDLIITEFGAIPPSGVYSLVESKLSWLTDERSWWVSE